MVTKNARAVEMLKSMPPNSPVIALLVLVCVQAVYDPKLAAIAEDVGAIRETTARLEGTVGGQAEEIRRLQQELEDAKKLQDDKIRVLESDLRYMGRLQETLRVNVKALDQVLTRRTGQLEPMPDKR